MTKHNIISEIFGKFSLIFKFVDPANILIELCRIEDIYMGDKKKYDIEIFILSKAALYTNTSIYAMTSKKNKYSKDEARYMAIYASIYLMKTKCGYTEERIAKIFNVKRQYVNYVLNKMYKLDEKNKQDNKILDIIKKIEDDVLIYKTEKHGKE